MSSKDGSSSSAPHGKRQRTTTNESIRPSTPDLDSRSTTASSTTNDSPPVKRVRREYGDRFIPDRSDDVRTAYHLMDDPQDAYNKPRMFPTESDAQKEQSNLMFQTILQTELRPASTSSSRPVSPVRPSSGQPSSTPNTPTRQRLFSYHAPSPHASPVRGSPRLDDDAFQLSPVRGESRKFLDSQRYEPRAVSKTPFRVLDAPELADDFYLSELSWSSTNILAVGLGSCVYLWNAQTAEVQQLCDYTSSDVVTSVSWTGRGSTIAVGTHSGQVHLWDAGAVRPLRTYSQHTERVGTVAWSDGLLASGSRDRTVILNDVRDHTPVRRLAHHRQEVCGLSWNHDTGYLASGGNDNKVLVWDTRGNRDDTPLWKFHEHTAAVKALAWNPHMPHCLATGGGTQDKYIRWWNSATGTMTHELDTGSQVCALLWSKTTHELVSSHGFSATAAQNQILIFRYPTLSMVASLTGHTSRVLYLAMSPDGETVVSGAGDETLRFWTVFPKKSDESSRARSQ
ncbi:WD40 repeat-like protein, partial [Exidia glandulosa HHB12029]